jgi:hypothetical protein
MGQMVRTTGFAQGFPVQSAPTPERRGRFAGRLSDDLFAGDGRLFRRVCPLNRYLHENSGYRIPEKRVSQQTLIGEDCAER